MMNERGISSPGYLGKLERHDTVAKQGERSRETSPSARLAERRERRLEVFFQEREKQAQAIVTWMRRMEQVDVPEHYFSDELEQHEGVFSSRRSDEVVFEKELMKDIEHLSPELRKAFQEAWYRWAEVTREAKEALRDTLGSSAASVEVGVASEKAGRELFSIRVKREPIGEARFLLKGPFYYLSFANTQDYSDFKKAICGHADEGEGGCYIGRTSWSYKRVPTLLQKGLEFDKRILTHEAQHFLNHALGAEFEHWEQSSSTQSEKVAASSRAVKDELLAYMRDGRPHWDKVYSYLAEDPLYADLYRGLTQEEAATIKKQLREVLNALKNHPWTGEGGLVKERSGFHAREMMVASLLDIPLAKMVKYIHLSYRYYEKKTADMDPPPLPLPSNASQAERTRWREDMSVFIEGYHKKMGLVPEYGLLSPQEEDERAQVIAWQEYVDGPPPIPSGDEEEDRRRLDLAEQQQKIAIAELARWREQAGLKRRLDEVA